jgi:hypothetical protein
VAAEVQHFLPHTFHFCHSLLTVLRYVCERIVDCMHVHERMHLLIYVVELLDIGVDRTL